MKNNDKDKALEPCDNIEKKLSERTKVNMTQTKRLRELIQTKEIVAVPGAYDAITAKLIEKAGFDAVYITGSGISLSLLGQPDLNTVSYLELRERINSLLTAIDIPMIVDIDTGFGGPLNLIRLVQEFERMGVAAVQIEDQQAPKRCGHEPYRRIVSIEEMQKRIQAIVDTRSSEDGLVVIARTDARTTHGLEECISRANTYLDSGADVVFIESPESKEEVFRIGREVHGPVLFNNVEGGRSPFMTQKELIQAGIKLTIYPNALTRIVTKSILKLLRELKQTGTTEGIWEDMLDHREVWDLFDNPMWLALESKYTPDREGVI